MTLLSMLVPRVLAPSLCSPHGFAPPDCQVWAFQLRKCLSYPGYVFSVFLPTNCIRPPGPPELPLHSPPPPFWLYSMPRRLEPPPRSVWSGCSCPGGAPTLPPFLCLVHRSHSNGLHPLLSSLRSPVASCLWSLAFSSAQDSRWLGDCPLVGEGLP